MDLNKQSAVLVLHEQTTDSLILTKRSAHLRQHPGEICFPGGIRESGDVDLFATALRELEEELGVGADRVTLIRPLNIEHTLLGSVIQPFLAHIESLDPFVLNSEEVSLVLSLPMKNVTNPEHYRKVYISHNGVRFETLEFIRSGEYVWGATARIMRQLCEGL